MVQRPYDGLQKEKSVLDEHSKSWEMIILGLGLGRCSSDPSVRTSKCTEHVWQTQDREETFVKKQTSVH